MNFHILIFLKTLKFSDSFTLNSEKLQCLENGEKENKVKLNTKNFFTFFKQSIKHVQKIDDDERLKIQFSVAE